MASHRPGSISPRLAALFFALAAAAAPGLGCGDDDGPPATVDGAPVVFDAAPIVFDASVDAAPELPNEGFVPPTAIAHANELRPVKDDTEWFDLGPADWSCLDTPGDDVASPVAITLNGVVHDFLTPTDGVAAATVAAFAGINHEVEIGSVVTDEDGAFTGLVLPAGQTRVGFKVTADRYQDTYLLNQIYTPDVAAQAQEILAISNGTAAALPALIQIRRTPGTGVLAGAITDCAGKAVSNTIATVSTVRGEAAHVENGITFYFRAAAGVLVVHDQQAATDQDGLFVVFQLPPAAESFIQVWGFTTEDELATGTLRLLGELPSPVIGDAVITATVDPLRVAPEAPPDP